jgi:hypothetical protein
MHIAALVFACLLRAFGIVALFLISLIWHKIEDWYQEWWAKVGLTAARGIGAAIAILSAYSLKSLSAEVASAALSKQAAELAKQAEATQSTIWFAAQIVAVAGYAVWEICAWLGDYRSKGTVEKVGQLRRQGVFRTRLLTALRGLVNEKRHRLQQVITRSGTGTLPRVKEALSPTQHVGLLLRELVFFLREQLPDTEESQHQNFRIGLYVSKDGSMFPIASFDLKHRDRDPFSSYREFHEHFRLDRADAGSLVVRCVREKRMLIVSDCLKEKFVFYREDQKTYLKSIVAFPILLLGGADQMAAIVIDTNRAGHFKEEDRESIEMFMDEFAARLDLEAFLDRVLKPANQEDVP